MGLLDLAFEDGRPWTRIGEHFGVTKKPRGFDLSQTEAVHFYPMEAIPQGGIYEPSTGVTKSPGEITSGTYFERGDVLVSKITPSFENGKQALVRSIPQDFGYATTEVIPLHATSPRSDPRFLFFYLLHPDVRHHIAERMEGSTGRQRVPERLLLNLPMPEFDKRVQSRIADALELIQDAAAVERAEAATATDLRAAAMQHLFTCGLQGGPQLETEIGPIPQGWKIGPLGNLALFQRGFDITKSAQSEGGTVPVVSSGGVKSFHDVAAVSGPGVVIGRKGSIGSVHYVSSDYWPHDTTLWCKDFLGNLPKFVYYRLQLVDMKRLDSGAANPALNRNFLHAEVTSWPDVDEQQQIVEVLEAIDRKIELHSRKRDVLGQLFESLLHKLTTGAISIDDLDLSALPSVDGSAA